MTEIWEPPIAGTEAEHLLAALDRMRWTFRYKADGLDKAGLNRRIGASTLTLAGLIKHLAAVEDYKTTVLLNGDPIGEPWEGFGWDGSNDWEFESAADDSPEDLLALYDDAVNRSRARLAKALAEKGPEQPIAHERDGQHWSLRRLLCDMIEEYARHTGHADLLREAADGRVGEDPPARWRPVNASAAF